MDDKAILIFNTLQGMSNSPEGRIFYILTLICLLMGVDFITGTIAAIRNPNIKFNSNAGINGILRKLVSIIVLVCCVPLAVLVPIDMGIAALYVLYIGYLLMEAKSIIENLEKLGVEISPLMTFIKKLEKETEGTKDE